VLIKKAEAEAESTYLSGIGLARMRTAIADGCGACLPFCSPGVPFFRESVDCQLSVILSLPRLSRFNCRYKGSITKIGDDVGLPSKDIVHMILMTQYLDNMDSFAKNTSSSILLPHGPGSYPPLPIPNLVTSHTDLHHLCPTSPFMQIFNLINVLLTTWEEETTNRCHTNTL
jgi:hypothetical protein